MTTINNKSVRRALYEEANGNNYILFCKAADIAEQYIEQAIKPPAIGMTVKELIEILLSYPQNLQVAYSLHSEQVLLREDDIKVFEACEARPDGWVQHKRPDMRTQTYLLFPGN